MARVSFALVREPKIKQSFASKARSKYRQKRHPSRLDVIDHFWLDDSKNQCCKCITTTFRALAKIADLNWQSMIEKRKKSRSIESGGHLGRLSVSRLFNFPISYRANRIILAPWYYMYTFHPRSLGKKFRVPMKIVQKILDFKLKLIDF